MHFISSADTDDELWKVYQDNTPVEIISPYTPLLYSKTGVDRGIHYFFIFALKQRSWVLVRTASVKELPQ